MKLALLSLFAALLTAQQAPDVWIDIPAAGETLAAPMRIQGWAIETKAAPGPNAIATVTITVDGVPDGDAHYGDARPDVCAVFPGRMGCPNVGWSYSLVSVMNPGAHVLRVTATDTAGVSAFAERAFITTAPPPSVACTVNGTVQDCLMHGVSMARNAEGRYVIEATPGDAGSTGAQGSQGAPGTPSIGAMNVAGGFSVVAADKGVREYDAHLTGMAYRLGPPGTIAAIDQVFLDGVLQPLNAYTYLDGGITPWPSAWTGRVDLFGWSK